MKWRDGFWSACTYVMDTTVGMTANSLNVLGTIAYELGGALFSLSYAVYENCEASYFGSVVATGTVNFNVNVTKLNYVIKNDTLIFGDYLNKTGGLSYNLQNYISQNSLLKISLILIGAGTLLKLSGTNIQYWQNSRLDARFYQNEYRLNIDSPSVKEFMHVNAGSVLNSMTDVLRIQAAVGTYIRFSKWFNTKQGFTYPDQGNQINSANYTGPVASVSIPVTYPFNENITVSNGDMNVEANGVASMLANVTYGVGLFFNPTRSSNPPIAVPAVVSVGSQLAGTFFANNAKQLRERRVHKGHTSQIIYEQLLSESDNTDLEEASPIP
jgi:hypothetical protein